MRQELLQLEQQRVHHIFEKEKLSIINATPEEMYRIAEINPNLFGTKYTRWGCYFKCKKCNGYRVHTGGIRSLLQISRIVNEQKYEHRKSCKHPKWEENWSLHAAEIAHTFVEQTTEQTHTGDTNYTDITGATITSSNFTATRKYLITTADVIKGAANDQVGVKTLHGSTDFTESELVMEAAVGNAHHHNLWFTVWTAISAEAIKMQHKTFNSGQTVSNDTITLTSIEISEDLTEGTDWDFNHNSTSTSLDNIFASFASLTVQTADHTSGDTYMVLGYSRIKSQTTAKNYETRINRSGEASSTEPTWSQEGEEFTNTHLIEYLARTFDLGAADNTFTIECRHDAGAELNGLHKHSSVFVLNLEKFKDNNENFTEADLTLGTVDFATEILTLSLTPSQTGDVFVLGFFIGNFTSITVFINSRLQVEDNTGTENDEPAGQSAILQYSQAWDVDDQLGQATLTVENLNTNSHKIDIDGDGTTSGQIAEKRQLIVFTMELAAAGGVALVKVAPDTKTLIS